MPTIWLIGNLEGANADAWSARVRTAFPDGSVDRFRSPGDALRTSCSPPDLVLVVQQRPSEFPKRDVDALIGAQPLARFVVGLGPWCGSHGRSERVWPEAATVPFRGVPARLRLEFEVLFGRRTALPITAGTDEVFERDEIAANVWCSGRPVAFDVADRALRDSLADMIRSMEGNRSEATDDPPAEVVFADLDPVGLRNLQRLARLRRQRPGKRIIAMTGSANPADEERLLRCGADRVLWKPFTWGELQAAIADERSRRTLKKIDAEQVRQS